MTAPAGLIDTGRSVTIPRRGTSPLVIPIYAAYGNEPMDDVWPLAQEALMRMLLPKARELLAQSRARRDAELHIPEYIEEGI
jgi:hypothetical protein